MVVVGSIVVTCRAVMCECVGWSRGLWLLPLVSASRRIGRPQPIDPRRSSLHTDHSQTRTCTHRGESWDWESVWIGRDHPSATVVQPTPRLASLILLSARSAALPTRQMRLVTVFVFACLALVVLSAAGGVAERSLANEADFDGEVSASHSHSAVQCSAMQRSAPLRPSPPSPSADPPPPFKSNAQG